MRLDMTARRHHYVPQCYLKGFTVERKKRRQITVFDGVEKKIFTTALENVALERDFNRFEAEGIAPDAFENKLAEMESEFAKALDYIIEKQSIANDIDRANLLNLICSLGIRNPRFRETVRSGHERVSKLMLELTTKTPERWAAQSASAIKSGTLKESDRLTYEQAKDFVERDQYTIELATERHIQLEIGAFDKVLPTFFARKWTLLIASSKSGGFITSDHPVILSFSDPKMRGKMFSPGFGLRNTEVAFPISTRLAVVGRFEGSEAEMDVGEYVVAAINGGQVAYSERQVYARDANFHYLMTEEEPPRKASKLIDDKRFRKGLLAEEEVL